MNCTTRYSENPYHQKLRSLGPEVQTEDEIIRFIINRRAGRDSKNKKAKELLERVMAGELVTAEPERKLLIEGIAVQYPLLTKDAEQVIMNAVNKARELGGLDAVFRDEIIRILAVSMAKLDFNRGLELIDEVEPWNRIIGLRAMARNLESSRAREVLERAISLVREQDENFRASQEMRGLGLEMAQYDPKLAEQFLEEWLELKRKRVPEFAWELNSIATGFPGFDRERRLEMLNATISKARNTEDNHTKAGNLLAIADAVTKADPHRSEELLDEAETVAAQIEDLSNRFIILFHTAKMRYRYDREKGLEIFREAVRTIAEVEKGYKKNLSVYHFKKELPFLPLEDASLLSLGIATSEDMEMVLESARKLGNMSQCVEIIFKISAGLRNRDAGRAIELQNEAIDLAKSMENALEGVIALTGIAWLSMESDRELAEELFAEAESVAEGIEDSEEKGRAEYFIAYRKAGLNIEHGLEKAMKIESDDIRAEALLNIALETGITDIARSMHIFELAAESEIVQMEDRSPLPQDMIEEGVQRATSADDPLERIYVLLELALRIAERNREEAKNLLDMAGQSLRQIRDLQTRAEIIALIVKGLLKVDDVTEALYFARSARDLWIYSTSMANIACYIYRTDREKGINTFKEALAPMRRENDEIKYFYRRSRTPRDYVAEIDGDMAVEMAVKETRESWSRCWKM